MKNTPYLAAFGKAVIAANVAVTVIYAVARATGDQLITRPEFGSGEPEPLGLAVVLGATVAGGLIGVGLSLLCRRVTTRPERAFLTISTVALVAYGVLAFVRAETAGTALWLNLMHVGAAIPLIGTLAKAESSKTHSGLTDDGSGGRTPSL